MFFFLWFFIMSFVYCLVIITNYLRKERRHKVFKNNNFRLKYFLRASINQNMLCKYRLYIIKWIEKMGQKFVQKIGNNFSHFQIRHNRQRKRNGRMWNIKSTKRKERKWVSLVLYAILLLLNYAAYTRLKKILKSRVNTRRLNANNSDWEEKHSYFFYLNFLSRNFLFFMYYSAYWI